MKVIALSDTHGNIDIINELAKRHQADAVLHCGDFGFFTYQRLEEITKKELYLNLAHWPSVPRDVKLELSAVFPEKIYSQVLSIHDI